MTHDIIDTSLESLPGRDTDPRIADRIRRYALATLCEERERIAHPWRGRAARFWDLAEPVLSSVVVGVYLVWLGLTLVDLMR